MADPVWITGVRGFLGAHLAKAMASDGVPVVGFARHPAPPQKRQNALYPLTSEGFATALADHGAPARVFHLAGGATVGQSFADPHKDFLSNVGTTETLLEALRAASLQVPVVFTSSAAVYGEGYPDTIKTSENRTPSSPYGTHKAMAEHLMIGHAQAFGLGVTILRLFSIYGSGLQKQLLFDVCKRLDAAPAAEPLTLGGTGAERRDWLHVTDAAAGMATLADPAPGEARIYNLASGQATEIRVIGEGLVKAWGDGRAVAFSGQSRAGDPFSLVADPASMPPGFQPKIILDDGLSSFVAWFRDANAAEQRP